MYRVYVCTIHRLHNCTIFGHFTRQKAKTREETNYDVEEADKTTLQWLYHVHRMDDTRIPWQALRWFTEVEKETWKTRGQLERHTCRRLAQFFDDVGWLWRNCRWLWMDKVWLRFQWHFFSENWKKYQMGKEKTRQIIVCLPPQLYNCTIVFLPTSV